MPRIELTQLTGARLDRIRGDVSRNTFVRDLIYAYDAGTLVPADTIAPSVDDILTTAVARAAQAYRDHRPGFGEYLLTRAALASQAVEDLQTSEGQ